MKLKSNTMIKLMEEVTAIQPKKAVIPQFEVVTVINDMDDRIRVKDIIDDEYIIPKNTLYKIVGTSKEKSVIKASNPVTRLIHNSVTKAITTPNKLANRAVQKMQTIASNMTNSEDSIICNRLLLASICASLALEPNLDSNQANRLITITQKLISNANAN